MRARSVVRRPFLNNRRSRWRTLQPTDALQAIVGTLQAIVGTLQAIVGTLQAIVGTLQATVGTLRRAFWKVTLTEIRFAGRSRRRASLSPSVP